MTKFQKVKDRIDWIFNGVATVAKFVAACFLVVMICTVSVQVIGRIFHFKVPVTEEIGTYSLIWMTYIASIAVLIKGEHLTVDLFLNRYKPSQRRVVRVIVDVLILIFCSMLMIFGFQLCQSPIIINGRTPALQMSRLYVYLSVPIAMSFSTLYNIYDLIVAIADIVFKGALTEEENRRKAIEEAKHDAERAQEEAAIRSALLANADGEKEDEQV
ncbi:MAG: TRAP transporter small permease [Butyricicoccus sp.]|nr:TRAP transporter small permease [Butyricicoccus sp.]MBQ8586354.1 TRAP transporter small permease [Butyricicoccus sp.]